jgi:hypothetical protein
MTGMLSENVKPEGPTHNHKMVDSAPDHHSSSTLDWDDLPIRTKKIPKNYSQNIEIRFYI